MFIDWVTKPRRPLLLTIDTHLTEHQFLTLYYNIVCFHRVAPLFPPLGFFSTGEGGYIVRRGRALMF